MPSDWSRGGLSPYAHQLKLWFSYPRLGGSFCKHHHNQLIKEKGNLSQLEGDNEESMNKKVNGREVTAES